MTKLEGVRMAEAGETGAVGAEVRVSKLTVLP